MVEKRSPTEYSTTVTDKARVWSHSRSQRTFGSTTDVDDDDSASVLKFPSLRRRTSFHSPMPEQKSNSVIDVKSPYALPSGLISGWTTPVHRNELIHSSGDLPPVH